MKNANGPTPTYYYFPQITEHEYLQKYNMIKQCLFEIHNIPISIIDNIIILYYGTKKSYSGLDLNNTFMLPPSQKQTNKKQIQQYYYKKYHIDPKTNRYVLYINKLNKTNEKNVVEKYKISASVHMACGELKELIRAQTGDPIYEQRLIFAAQQLEDDKGVHSGMQSESTLHLVLRTRPNSQTANN